jgi:hypothetical protein
MNLERRLRISDFWNEHPMPREPLTYKRLSTQPGGLALLVLNAIGAVVYLYRASPSWAIPAERELGLHSTTGEPFIWFVGILPVVAVFFVLNVTWGALILRRRWRSGRLWLLATACWLVAVWVDFAHH